ncbi:hypothetical protein BSFA1_81120 (plasmid) [Burkholderia sp. SFA1]|nr:hypothetical protein [Burkholderia vietnamiensis]BBQ02984.1 hypothetical protein BSFA1_81120 [Burkholderia sp. SFA1]
MFRERDPLHHYPVYAFGDLVRGRFPHEQATRRGQVEESARWMFVLQDLGRRVLVCYCTTNTELRCHKPYRLGLLPDGKVTNIVPDRFEVLDKSRLFLSRGVERVEYSHILPYIGIAAKRGIYDGYSADVLEIVIKEAQRAERRKAKLAARTK